MDGPGWSTSVARARAGLSFEVPDDAGDLLGGTARTVHRRREFAWYGFLVAAVVLSGEAEKIGVRYALGAYNAGGGRAKNWVRSDVDLAVEEIDIASTNLYVRQNYAFWKQYQEIYK